MTIKHEIEIPDSVTVTMGGEEFTIKTAEIDSATFNVMFWHGFARKANDAFSSAKSAHKNATGKEWLPSDATAAREKILSRIKSGDWGRAESTPRDPVGDLAATMAKEAIVTRFAAALGVDASTRLPRARTLWDKAKGDVRKVMAKYLDVDGKSMTWRDDAVAEFVEKNDLRAAAEKELARRAKAANALGESVADILADL